MRIMLTVLGEHGARDVAVEADETITVARLGDALRPASGERLAEVVRLPHASHKAPYGAPYGGGRRAAPPLAGPVPRAGVWSGGRLLDPAAPVAGLLRDGDLITLDARFAGATTAAEPSGIVEVRVVGGPDAGGVHRLGLGVHVVGSATACAVAVRDPSLPPEAAVVRVGTEGITVEPYPRAEPAAGHPAAAAARPGGTRGSTWPQETGSRRKAARPEAGRGDGGAAGLPGTPVTLDGRDLDGAEPWPVGGILTCGTSAFTLAPVEPPDAHLDARPDGGLAYNRPPRLARPDRTRRLEVPVMPKRNEGARLQLLAAFLPAVLGVAFALITGYWYFLLFALMTPVLMIGQWWSDRRHGRKQHRQAMKLYRERMAAFEEDLEDARSADERARRAASPDPAEVLLTATGPRRRLWERRIHDPDALRLRVGLADLPADLELAPERGASGDAQIPDTPLSRSVPVSLPMRRLGVAGVTGPRQAATGLARWLIGQAAALHSPRDLAIVVLSAHADGADRWGWTRWLPHCAPRGGEDCVALVGADPEAAARRVTELAALIEERLGEENTPSAFTTPPGWDGPGWSGAAAEEPAFSAYDERPYDILVLVDGAQVLRGLPGMPQVLRRGPRAGVYTLALDEDQRLLPEECATVVACEPDGTAGLRGGGLDAIGPVLADQVPIAWCDRLARALAPIRDVSRQDSDAALPDAARLLDLLGLTAPSGAAVAAHWKGATTRAVIGVGPDGPFAVDLRLDGPHALIAGTTGAGKSELLQTLISALAVANRPDEMTFVLIDYKGGAAFKECVRLPHTVGMVTDLDGHLTGRALASLAAEIRRRERLLLAAGAKDIEDYHAQAPPPGTIPHPAAPARDPLPRLVLIIDEFAALVNELPDFVAGLVDIARRGRSLGIHLILATQRPAGVVTADIQANTSLRIALRVTEAGESTDVIDRPDAARIAKSTPGRCYVKSGAGAPTAVQTARIGGLRPVDPDRATERLSVTELPWRDLGRPLPVAAPSAEGAVVSDLSVLTDAIVQAARLLNVPAQPSPWLPPLPDRITLADLGGLSAASGTLAFGMTDMPSTQSRRALGLNLVHGGHLLIAGSARSGRSTALRTLAGVIAARESPADVHVHAVDCGSGALLPLVAMPHCGAVVTRDQLNRVERLIDRLRAEVGRRQQLLAAAGFASLAELRAARRVSSPASGSPASPHLLGLAAGDAEVPPWLVLMLDRWEGFVAAFENYDYGRLVEAMLQLLREGPAVGLRAVVTADRSGLLGQISTVFEDRLILRLSDPADYGLAALPAKELPSVMPPGRAVALGEEGVVESQIALLADDPAGPAQVAAFQALARTAAPAPGALAPLRVDALPPRITVTQVRELVPGFAPPSPLWALLGAGGDALAPLGVDLLAQGPGAVIAGPARSGRSSALLTAARSLAGQGTPVVVVTPRRSPLRALDGTPGVLAVLDAQGGDLAEIVAGRERYVVLVDDAELVGADTPLGTALEEVLRSGRDADHGLIIAGTTGDLTTAYRGFVAEARKSRTGLLLSVQNPADGDLFTVRLPRGAVGGPPGRGLLVTQGTVTPIQAALPD